MCLFQFIKNGGGSKLTSSDVTNNGTLKFAGATNGFATPLGTVEYNGAGTQTVYSGSYNNLIISGARSSNTITLDNSGAINVAGSFNPSASACTWTTTGTSIAFNGTTAQSLASTFTFNNLTINNSSSTGVTLNAALYVGGALTLSDGFVYTTTSNILTVLSVGTSSGGSDASHVEGSMQKIGSTSFDFPVGKSGIWPKIGFTTAGGFDASTTMSAEYFYTASTNSSNVGAGIHNVSKVEYWDITRVSDPSNDASCNVTLYFNNKTRSKIAGTGTDLKTVHYESGVWTNKGGTFHDNGDGTGYIVSTTALTSFSPESVGSTDGSSSLPIELTSFNASISDDKVLIVWSTASELNNQFFTLERSKDGLTWEQIYTCNGVGTSTKTHYYDYYDNDDINGQEYYRLKQTDVDGTTIISDVRTVQYTKNDTLLLVYPNPAKMDDMILTIDVPFAQIFTILISNSMGTIVSEGKIEAMEKKVKIRLNEICRLQPGVYSILVRGRDCIKNKEIIIQ
jgi:hypothetical protein